MHGDGRKADRLRPTPLSCDGVAHLRKMHPATLPGRPDQDVLIPANALSRPKCIAASQPRRVVPPYICVTVTIQARGLTRWNGQLSMPAEDAALADPVEDAHHVRAASCEPCDTAARTRPHRSSGFNVDATTREYVGADPSDGSAGAATEAVDAPCPWLRL
jgi:hypothetical protein